MTLTPEQLQAIEQDKTKLVAKTDTLNEVKNKTQLQEGAEWLCFAHDRVKRIQLLQAEKTAPLKEGLKGINDMFKELIKPYEESKAKMKELIKGYMVLRRQQAVKKYRRLKEEDPLAIVEMPDPVVQTTLGNVHVRRTKRMQVDTEKLPNEFWKLEVDAEKIQEAIKSGNRPEGVEIIEDIDIVPLNHTAIKNEK